MKYIPGTCYVGLQRSYKSVTTNIVNFLGDFLSSVIGTVVVMYLMTHTNLAMRIINSLQHQWRQIPETQTVNSPSDWLLVLSVVVLTVGMCILPITFCLDKDVLEIVIVFDIYEEILWYAIKLFVIGFLFSVIRLESLVYKNLRTSLVRLLKGQEGSENSPDESPSSKTESESMPTNEETEIREHSNLSKHKNKVDGEVSNLGTISYTGPSDHTNNKESVLKLGKISSTTNSEDINTKETDGDTTDAASPNTIFLSLLKGTRRTLVEVHTGHRLLLTYLGFPVTLVLFNSLYDFIISFYYYLAIHTTSWISQIKDMSYLLLTILPLLLLPNLPVVLQSQPLPSFILNHTATTIHHPSSSNTQPLPSSFILKLTATTIILHPSSSNTQPPPSFILKHTATTILHPSSSNTQPPQSFILHPQPHSHYHPSSFILNHTATTIHHPQTHSHYHHPSSSNSTSS
ncbi:hypothetical protein Pcinc_019988 [Petrolisthes cinctipes]|uniref:Uncharacterized protein n=1 Tax=Petrolisthes cinctipes TaxID=88211 RepID=A0AAE1KJL9_PETCI|nr:hypothetical protein Pcinc_019988 [Petrolisthes cinctipes]